MARGKHATLAANNRYTAAMEHIDRLTNEIAELKVRTKMVEADAREAPVLRKEIARLKDDPVLDEIVAKVAAAYKDRDRQFEAWKLAEPDLWRLFRDVAASGLIRASLDRQEFVERRYPKLMAFLTGRDHDLLASRRYHPATTMKLSDAAATRFERAVGLRGVAAWDEHRDFATIASDLADVARMKLTSDEIFELLEVPTDSVADRRSKKAAS